MQWIIPFSQKSPTPISEVGGKGHSLIRLFQAGLQIPPGVVLSVAFFERWFESLRGTDAWSAFTAADTPAGRGDACLALKEETQAFRLNSVELEAIEASLRDFTDDALFAVRSSSPEEDLAGSSFAGGYETVLGVTRATLEDAIRHAFASCLDERIVVYKEQQGFDTLNPRIAVVIQQQIASEVAGVGFSINPITNDHDEAVFSSNWGLGETVVGGLASPDLFIVNKASNELVERQVGAKETALWLTPTGGTELRPDPRHDALTLDDAQVLELTAELRRVEALYDAPMDIEWAFCAGQLYLLQARPITTHVPLHPEMMTAPGASKRLYFDIALSVQGLLEPLSVMGNAFLEEGASVFSVFMFGKDITRDVETTIPIVRNGRIYLNMSNMMRALDRDRIAHFFENFDPLASSALRAVDVDAYRSRTFSKRDKARAALPRALRIFFTMLWAGQNAARARRRCDATVERWRREVTARAAAPATSLQGLAHDLLVSSVAMIFRDLAPRVIAGRRAIGAVRAEFPTPTSEIAEHLEALDKALPGNVTIEMGLAIDDLSKKIAAWPALAAATSETLARAILAEDSALPVEFSSSWKKFIDTYGHRGLTELDIASPRYRDDSGILLKQILQLARDGDDETSAVSLHAHATTSRRAAYRALEEALSSSFKRWRHRRRCALIEQLGGLRETHKFCVIFALDLLRQRVLVTAQDMVDRGRLDDVAQVFDLTLSDLDEGLIDASLDLRALGSTRRRPHDELAQSPALPRLIDSRGRIIRAPRPPARAGEMVGQPVSAGIVRGPVKILHTPDEKPLLKGEILVARATDPGWTPLFVNASGIILEVGGLLQHGALVAREYGKPCVAGIQGALERLQDGVIVEVDGNAGTVRWVEVEEER